MPSLKVPALNTRSGVLLAGFLLACGILAVQSILYWDSFARSLGDSDDALRLVMLRELIGGKGWYSPHLDRFQPPLGTDMHWSRLIDGGLVALHAALSPFMAPSFAEDATRFVWPLLWIPAALAAVMAIALRLGGPGAAIVCGLLLLLDRAAFIQFHPGRIDHHNVQIALTLVVIALVLHAPARRGLVPVAGAITGMLLAIGLEALVFAAIAGIVIALGFVRDPSFGRAFRAYALALAASIAGSFALQTAPTRWFLPACDALGSNLVASIVVIAAGVALATNERFSAMLAGRKQRLVAVGAIGLCGFAAFAAVEPACLAGPFGQIDSRIRPIWLDHVPELLSLSSLFARDAESTLMLAMAPMLGLASLIMLWLDGSKREDGSLAVISLLFAAAVALFLFAAFRSSSYAIWLAMPLIATALASRIPAAANGRLAAMILCCAASPYLLTLLVLGVVPQAAARAEAPAWSKTACIGASAFADVAREPRGLVLAPPEIGSYILAHTHHDVLSGPYHRMAEGLLAAHALFAARAGEGESAVRQRRIAYVAVCPSMKTHPAHLALAPESLLRRLEEGVLPPWLDELASGGELRVYRVRAER